MGYDPFCHIILRQISFLLNYWILSCNITSNQFSFMIISNKWYFVFCLSIFKVLFTLVIMSNYNYSYNYDQLIILIILWNERDSKSIFCHGPNSVRFWTRLRLCSIYQLVKEMTTSQTLQLVVSLMLSTKNF